MLLMNLIIGICNICNRSLRNDTQCSTIIYFLTRKYLQSIRPLSQKSLMNHTEPRRGQIPKSPETKLNRTVANNAQHVRLLRVEPRMEYGKCNTCRPTKFSLVNMAHMCYLSYQIIAKRLELNVSVQAILLY